MVNRLFRHTMPEGKRDKASGTASNQRFPNQSFGILLSFGGDHLIGRRFVFGDDDVVRDEYLCAPADWFC